MHTNWLVRNVKFLFVNLNFIKFESFPLIFILYKKIMKMIITFLRFDSFFNILSVYYFHFLSCFYIYFVKRLFLLLFLLQTRLYICFFQFISKPPDYFDNMQRLFLDHHRCDIFFCFF